MAVASPTAHPYDYPGQAQGEEDEKEEGAEGEISEGVEGKEEIPEGEEGLEIWEEADGDETGDGMAGGEVEEGAESRNRR